MVFQTWKFLLKNKEIMTQSESSVTRTQLCRGLHPVSTYEFLLMDPYLHVITITSSNWQIQVLEAKQKSPDTITWKKQNKRKAVDNNNRPNSLPKKTEYSIRMTNYFPSWKSRRRANFHQLKLSVVLPIQYIRLNKILHLWHIFFGFLKWQFQ